MDTKKLLIIAALGLGVFFILQRKKNAATIPPDDNEQPEDAGNTDGVVSTVDLSALASELSEADKELIRNGEDTTLNNFVSSSETR